MYWWNTVQLYQSFLQGCSCIIHSRVLEWPDEVPMSASGRIVAPSADIISEIKMHLRYIRQRFILLSTGIANWRETATSIIAKSNLLGGGGHQWPLMSGQILREEDNCHIDVIQLCGTQSLYLRKGSSKNLVDNPIYNYTFEINICIWRLSSSCRFKWPTKSLSCWWPWSTYR